VEAGKKRIPMTLFEASQKCDAGDYYFKDRFVLNGTELIDEIRETQVKKTFEMIERYLSLYPMRSKPQRGKATYTKRRTPKNSKLDINRTIRSQFDKMRAVDNERYPLYFIHKGNKYEIKIYKSGAAPK
jgi:methionyl-tRNA formyltransferase